MSITVIPSPNTKLGTNRIQGVKLAWKLFDESQSAPTQ